MSGSIKRFSFGRHPVVIDFGSSAEHTGSSVLVHVGQSVVLATCHVHPPSFQSRPPGLVISFVERSYARGQISDYSQIQQAELNNADRSRLLEFQSMLNDTLPDNHELRIELNLLVFSRDPQVEPIFAGVIAASCALGITSTPQADPIVLARLAKINGVFCTNPSNSAIEKSQCDLWIYGSSSQTSQVRGSANELDESELICAIEFGQREIRRASNSIKEWIIEHSTTNTHFTKTVETPLKRKIAALAKTSLMKIFQEVEKKDLLSKLSNLQKAVEIAICINEIDESRKNIIAVYFCKCVQEILREHYLKIASSSYVHETTRLHTRKVKAHLFPRAHGSASYTVGDHCAIALTTLGRDRSSLNGQYVEEKKSFDVHIHSFADDTGAGCQSPTRALYAGRWVADTLRSVVPKLDIFPYVIQVDVEQVGMHSSSPDEILCAAMLSMLDAGVPLFSVVGAVVVGVICSPSQLIPLIDPDDLEKASCNVVATVAGTMTGIAGIDLRSKTLLTREILQDLLSQAKQARFSLIALMEESIGTPKELSKFAPRVQILKISSRKTGQLVGRGGSVVKAICQQTYSNVEVFPDGTVRVSASNDDSLQNAIIAIQKTLKPLKPGQVFEGVVSGIQENGLLINLSPGRDGFLPREQLLDAHLPVREQFKIGGCIRVVCESVNHNGQGQLSVKALHHESAGNSRY
ncbi:KH domain-containing protein [Pseudomonas sp. ANT_H12B]|uniref:KH domain-containing protein n=1 Tax=Pseudomonas sp. ANT_H12B TaxID=2597348 RepID=UPI0011F02018|nr:KH domain-containing protein [Pseudomonas sp. ANT_H12B]KAA0977012.1 S1 RNA-binding domain-containing protein [Pseudomonas sp. ANT_H12B]